MSRPLPHDEKFAESWEICDHGDDQSVVEGGPLGGKTLHELVTQYGQRLLGGGVPSSSHTEPAEPADPIVRFPLLLKYLDAAENLSLQVHPNDVLAAKLDPPELGKAEAWYVVATVPGSVIYAGLRDGVDRPALAEAIERGKCVECLHRFEARRGDCVFLPSGTVHALGAGILVAEIQQSSDVTYRLFDWNRFRLGADGRPRLLHIEQGLEAVDFARGPVAPIRCPAGRDDDSVGLVKSEQFNLDRRILSGPQQIGGDGRFHIITVVDGAVSVEGDRTVEGDPLDSNLRCGQSALLPAELGAVRFVPCPEATVLDTYV